MLKFLTNLPQKRQKMIVLSMPALTLALSIGMLLPAWQRYDQSKRQLEKQRGEIAELIRNLPKPNTTRTYFARNDSRESTLFVREISAISKGSACELTAFSAPGTLEATKSEKTTSDAPWHITPVTVQVSLVGSYPNIRRFLSGVINSRRVYSLSGIDLRARWNAEDGSPDTRVSAVIRIDRYIAMRARPSGKAPTTTDEGMPGLK